MPVTKNGAQPVLRINDDNGNKITSFKMPQGVIQNYVPAPDIQLTIGLVHHTDITIRTTPTINLGSNGGSVTMFGFGIKHDIIQDFAKKVPKPFDLAIAVNYNRITYTKGLSVQPDAGATPVPGQPTADFSTQHLNGVFSGVNVQAIISKRLLFFTPFASVGYQTANTDVGIYGNYPIQATGTGQGTFYTVVKDPVHITETSIPGSMRADFGFQLNLLILRIYASYSVGGSYNSANAGVGLGF